MHEQFFMGEVLLCNTFYLLAPCILIFSEFIAVNFNFIASNSLKFFNGKNSGIDSSLLTMSNIL